LNHVGEFGNAAFWDHHVLAETMGSGVILRQAGRPRYARSGGYG
jgi:hypothetical protein